METNIEKELSNTDYGKDILFCQEQYIKSKIVYEEHTEKLTWNIGKATLVSVLIALAYGIVKLSGSWFNVIMFLPLFLMVGFVGFPFSMSFGTRKLARFLFKPLFYAQSKIFEKAEKDMFEKRENLKNELFSKQAKAFIFNLYVFLEEKLKDGIQPSDENKNPSNTILLFELLKKIIGVYESSESSFEEIMKYMTEMRGRVVKLSQDIEQENKNNLLIKEFLKSHLSKSLEEEIVRNDEILFKKSKYRL